MASRKKLPHTSKTIDLAPFFLQEVQQNLDYETAVNIASSNSNHKNMWAIGGLVYRNIINGLHGRHDEHLYDFDFILESPVPFTELSCPAGWQISKTGLGQPRFTKNNKQVDLVDLNSAATSPNFDLNQNIIASTSKKISRYFDRVPLTVQAIAFDYQHRQIIGKKGIQAIMDEQITVNNLDECINFCKRRRISVREFLFRKSKDLQFKIKYPVFSNPSKNETTEFYDLYSQQYSQTRGNKNEFINKYLEPELNFFLKNITGKKLLDLGSGPGGDSILFKSHGLHPVCVDISKSMINICLKQHLEAYQMDMENLDLPNSSFDAVWAYASLVHIPKNRVCNTLARIYELLKPNGLFFVGMVEGADEVMYQSTRNPNKRRFFARYEDEEFTLLLDQYFEILNSKRIVTSTGEIYLNYICRKPEKEFIYSSQPIQ